MKAPSDDLTLQLQLVSLNQEEVDYTFKYVVNNYSAAFYNAIRSSIREGAKEGAKYHVTSNFSKLLDIAKVSKPMLKEVAEEYYVKLLQKDMNTYCRQQFIKLFSTQYQNISKEPQGKFEKYIIEKFKRELGTYTVENQITDIIEPIWEDLSQSTRKELSKIYLDIFVSDRTAYHSQKKFAIKLLSGEMISKSAIQGWLDEKLRASKEHYEAPLNQSAINTITTTYKPIATYIDKGDKWAEFVTNKLNNL